MTFYRIHNPANNTYYRSAKQGGNSGWDDVGEFFRQEPSEKLMAAAMKNWDPSSGYAWRNKNESLPPITVVTTETVDSVVGLGIEYLRDKDKQKFAARMDPQDIVKYRLQNPLIFTGEEVL